MLESLFGSKSRVKILSIFLLNPANNYYLRQLARDLKLQVDSVRREIQNLQNLGLLKEVPGNGSELKGEKYYRLNPSFILFAEIKALILKAQALYGQEFLDDLHAICVPEDLVLSGLFVGEPELPIDLLVVAKVNRTKFLELVKKLEQRLGREINFTLLEEKDWLYRIEIADVFIYRTLKSAHLTLLNNYNHLDI